NIEGIGVLGWECVAKKGEFREGEPCVYFEIDSLLPVEPRYEFLRPSSFKPDLGKFKLRTVRLRKQLSQGLALPVTLFPEAAGLPIGADLTEMLGVEQYEPPIPTHIAGDTRTFRWPIAKTDEIRVQQDDEYHFLAALTGKSYFISLKLDGTSCTFIIDPKDGEFHACGRNYSYKATPDHAFWKVNDRYGIKAGLESLGGSLALQGEIVGPGIQSNKLGLKEVDFFVFTVVNTATRSRLPLDQALAIAGRLGVPFVPVLERGDSFSYSLADLLEKARGRYRDHFPAAKETQEREGIVVRSLCGSISFKAINNQFLLNEQ
ncbi:MAG: RNA ligase family protein, partial [Planctomycetia bacterium]